MGTIIYTEAPTATELVANPNVKSKMRVARVSKNEALHTRPTADNGSIIDGGTIYTGRNSGGDITVTRSSATVLTLTNHTFRIQSIAQIYAIIEKTSAGVIVAYHNPSEFTLAEVNATQTGATTNIGALTSVTLTNANANLGASSLYEVLVKGPVRNVFWSGKFMATLGSDATKFLDGNTTGTYSAWGGLGTGTSLPGAGTATGLSEINTRHAKALSYELTITTDANATITATKLYALPSMTSGFVSNTAATIGSAANNGYYQMTAGPNAFNYASAPVNISGAAQNLVNDSGTFLPSENRKFYGSIPIRDQYLKLFIGITSTGATGLVGVKFEYSLQS